MCSGVARFLVASTDRNRHTTQEVFDYFQCSQCQLVFMDPIPENLAPFYAGGYHALPSTMEEMEAIAERERYRMEPILAWRKSGRLLEIGPWMGVFSYNAKKAGFDVTALEMDQQCVDFMNEKLGIRAIQSTDAAATLATMQDRFDVIALWHCLEHLPDPWVVVRRAIEHLAPNGVLLIAIPNIESYEFSLLHAEWRNLDAPRHLYFFPKKSLIALCEGLGLKTLRITTNDALSEAFREETWLTMATSLMPVKYVRGLLRRTAKWLAARRERRDDSGPGLTAVFGSRSERPT